MAELFELHCIRVAAGTPHLTEQEISGYCAGLPGWEIREKDGVPRLERSFPFKDFRQALAFTYRVGQLAGEEDHHPAILTEWGRVTVTWWTHSIQGLHKNDFIMAAKTERLL